jgi:hypothetical protein
MSRGVHTNKALTDICKHLAEWELTDDEIAGIAANLPGEMEQFAKCDDCGCRSTDIDEAGQCHECHDTWARNEFGLPSPEDFALEAADHALMRRKEDDNG